MDQYNTWLLLVHSITENIFLMFVGPYKKLPVVEGRSWPRSCAEEAASVGCCVCIHMAPSLPFPLSVSQSVWSRIALFWPR